jgi:transposase InsO family protein
VLTDRGGKFEAEFTKMLMESYIDHRTTSADHPQTDGLAERMIQTMKMGIKKLILSYGQPQDWDLKVLGLSNPCPVVNKSLSNVQS